jgi:integrase
MPANPELRSSLAMPVAMKRARKRTSRGSGRVSKAWWSGFGLLPPASPTPPRPRRKRGPQLVLISSRSRWTVRRFLEAHFFPKRLRRATARYRGQFANLVASLESFCAYEVALDQLSDDLLDRFTAWYRHTHSAKVTDQRWGMLRDLWREAHRRGLVARRPQVRRPDTSVVLIQNYCRADRTLRNYFYSVYWPRRSPFCCEGSMRDYTSAINAICRFSACEVTLDQLSDDLLERFAGWRLTAGRSAATANKNQSMIAALWRFAWRKRAIDDLPRDVEKIPEFKRLPEAWSVDQFAQILDAASTTEGMICEAPASHFFPALLLTLYDTGLRIGTTLKLPLSALGEDGWLSVPPEIQKHKTGQAFRVDPKTLELLRSLPRGNSDRLFPAHRWRYPCVALERRYRKILKRAGLPSGARDLFHKIRRTNATYTADSAGEEAAQKQLGHSHVGLTRRSYIDPRLLKRDQNVASLPRPAWSGGAEPLAVTIQQDRLAAPSMLHRAARGAHERGFSNPK